MEGMGKEEHNNESHIEQLENNMIIDLNTCPLGNICTNVNFLNS